MWRNLTRPLREQGEGGYVLLLVLVTTMALFIALSGILSLSMANLSGAKRTMFDTGALYAAESGVDNAVYQLNATNGAYTGTTSCPLTGTNGATDAFNDTVKGKGTYQTCVTAGSVLHEYVVYATGKTYKTATATSPVATRKLKVVVKGNPTGSYSVATGPGGLIMTNAAAVVGSNISVGGFVTMSNTARIGSTTQPVTLTVANARCPSGGGATYPQVCGTGVDPNPITISNSAHIYGTVTSNNQTNVYASAITNTGVVSTTGATAPALPAYDRPAQVSAVTSTISGAAASCSGNGSTVTWPSNVKITGNVTASQSCHIIVSGNAWVTGNVSLSNSADIKPAAGVATMPVIMVDGSTGLSTAQTSQVLSNSSGTGMEFITFYSTNSCTTATTSAAYCDTLTGTDLLNSQSKTTISLSNQSSAPGATLYAKYSKASLGQGGTIGAVAAQTLALSNSSTITITGSVVGGNYAYSVSYYEFQ